MSKKDTTGSSIPTIVDDDPFGPESAAAPTIVDDDPFGDASPQNIAPTPYSTPVAPGVPKPVDDTLRASIPAAAETTQVAVPSVQGEVNKVYDRFVSSPRSKVFSSPSQKVNGLDPRWEEVMKNYRASGGNMEDEGYAGSDLRDRAIRAQLERLKQDKLDFDIAYKEEQRRGVAQKQEQRLMEIEQRLTEYSRRIQAGEKLSGEEVGDYLALQSEGGFIAEEYTKRLAPFKAAQEEMGAMEEYLVGKLADVSIGRAKDPKEKLRKANQLVADARWRQAASTVSKQGASAILYDPAVQEQYLAKPVYDEVRRFGGNVGATALRMSSRLAKATTPADAGKPATDILDDAADWFSDGLRNIESQKPSATKTSLLSEEWDLNEGWLPKLVQGGTYMGIIMAGGWAGGTAGMTATSMIGSNEDYYIQGKDSGMSDGQAEAFALVMSGTEAAIEAINKGPFIEGAARSELAKRAAKAIMNGKPLRSATVEIPRYFLEQSGGEGVEEVLTSLSQHAIQVGADGLVGSHLGSELKLNELASDFIMGAALGGLMAAGGTLSYRPLYKESVQWAVENEQEFKDWAQDNVPEDQLGKVLERLDLYAKVYRGIPKEVPSDKAQTVAAAVVEKQEIKEQQANRIVDEAVAETVGDPLAERELQLTETIRENLTPTKANDARSEDEQPAADEGVNPDVAPPDGRGGIDAAIRDGSAVDGTPNTDGVAPTTKPIDEQDEAPANQGKETGLDAPPENTSRQEAPPAGPVSTSPDAGGTVAESIQAFNEANANLVDIDPNDFEGMNPTSVRIINEVGDGRVIAAVETDEGPVEVMLDQKPKPPFKEKDQVRFTKNGKELTGSIRSIDAEEGIATIDVDQVAMISGRIPIGRLESIPLSRLSPMDEQVPAQQSETAASPAPNASEAEEAPEQAKGEPAKTMPHERAMVKQLMGSKAVEALRNGDYGGFTGVGVGVVSEGGPYLELRKTSDGFGVFDRDSRKAKALKSFETVEEAIEWSVARKYEWRRSLGYQEEPPPTEEPPTNKAGSAPTPKKTSFSNLSEEKQARAEELRKKLLQKLGGQLNMGIDPEIISLGVEYGALAFENGARGFGKWAKEMVGTLGEEVKPYLEAIYNGMRNAASDKSEYTKIKEVKSMLKDIDSILSQPEEDGSTDVSKRPADGAGAPSMADGLSSGGGTQDGAGGDAPGVAGVEVQGVPPKESSAGGGAVEPDVAGSGGGSDAGNSDAGGSAGTQDGAATEGSGQAEGARTEEPVDPSSLNMVLPSDSDWIPRGDKSKVRANIDAIKLLRKLEEEGDRLATPEEKAVLARYTGWGGLKPAVDREKARQLKESGWMRSNPYYADRLRALESWKEEWGDVYTELFNLLGREAMDDAFSSSEYAHYTSRDVINATWKAIQRLGFTGGKALEPAIGIGHMIGLTPERLRGDIQWLGFDKDETSAKIARKLYPEERIKHAGYEDMKIRPNSLDLVFTNAPFSQTGVSDPNFPSSLNLHNYFIVRGLSELRPGGLMAMITSSSTMDGTSLEARKMMEERADLIGAIRLPNTAFKQNAGTEVVADILFFRKRDESSFRGERFTITQQTESKEGYNSYPAYYSGSLEDWNALSEEQKKEEIAYSNRGNRDRITVEEFRVNEYFKAHPEMVLGDLSIVKGRFGFEMTVEPRTDSPLSDQLDKAISMLPRNVIGKKSAQESEPEAQAAEDGARVGRLRMEDGKPYVVDQFGELRHPDWYSKDPEAAADKVRQAQAYIDLREVLEEHLRFEASPDASVELLDSSRERLNNFYDSYVDKFGHVRDLKKSEFLAETDRDFPSVAALESVRPETDKEAAERGEGKVKRVAKKVIGVRKVMVYEKMPIFFQQTTRPAERPDTAETISDAIEISLNWNGRIDIPYIASLLGKEEEQVLEFLRDGDVAFENPVTGGWEIAEEYLSGQVVDKLKEATAAASQDESFQRNVDALQKVQPERIHIERIVKPDDPTASLEIGARWVPIETYKRFANEVIGVPVKIVYVPEVGKFAVDWDDKDHNYGNTKNQSTWAVNFQVGTKDQVALTGIQIFDSVMGLKSPVVEYRVEGGRVVDQEATDLAKARVAEMNEAFLKFIKSNSKSSQEVEDAFNEKFNISVRPKYRIPTFTRFPGQVESIWDAKKKEHVPFALKDHQKQGVIRAMRESTIFAHGVGFGKTFLMITAAMELRRLGLAKKPMIAVMNSTLEQFAIDIKRIYPNAKVHVQIGDFGGPLDRNIFMAQAAMGDWDIVLVPHSVLNMLPNDPAREEAWINQQIEELLDAKRKISDNKGKGLGVTQINDAIRSLETKLEKLLDKKKDNAMTFEQLGVDALFVDESHEYKKLPFRSSRASGRDKIKGIDTGDNTGRGPSLLLKMRYVQERNRGRNTFLATGTPVTNTIAETWNIMRFLRPELLNRYGVSTFDEFETSFTRVANEIERTPTGKLAKVARLTNFKYLQKFQDLWLSIADVRMNARNAEIERPALKGGDVQVRTMKPVPLLEEYTRHLALQMKAWEAMPKKEKEEKKLQNIPMFVMQLSRLASMDMRFIDKRFEDDPQSKLNQVVKDVKRIYDEFSDVRGTQMIFSDMKFGLGGEKNPAALYVYGEIKRKLIEQGIPAEEIVIIHPHEIKKKKDVQKHIDLLKNGTYRVAIGSTASLGTGVNAQDLLAGLHHLDAPWMPKDIEQREGRIIRQGNRIFTEFERPVEVNRWVVESSFDGTLWAILTAKNEMVKQAIDGTNTNDTVSDGSESITMSYQQAKAAGTGDYRIFEKALLESEISRLERQEAEFFRLKRGSAAEVESLSRLIPLMEEVLAKDKAFAKDYGGLWKEDDQVSITIGDQTYNGRKDAVEALDKHFASIKERWPKTWAEATAIDMAVDPKRKNIRVAPSGVITFQGKKVALTSAIYFRNDTIDKEDSAIEFKFIEDPRIEVHVGRANVGAGFFVSMNKVIRAIEEMPMRQEQLMNVRKADLEEAKGRMGGDFPKRGTLEAKVERLKELNDSFDREPEKEIPPPTTAFPSLLAKVSELIDTYFADPDNAWEEEDNGDDEPDGGGGGGSKRKSKPSSNDDAGDIMPEEEASSIFDMSSDEMRAYFKAIFGHRALPSEGGDYAGKWIFPTFDTFRNWMSDRYAERDLEGMRAAFIEQPDGWKVRYVRESRKASAHLKDWISHIATGSPVPTNDPPIPRTTPRPGPDGKVPVAPPPPAPKPPAVPSNRVKFSFSALVQLARELGSFPQVREMVAGKRGTFLSETKQIILRRKLTWDIDQAGRTLAHEIGHLVDLAIELDGSGLSIARKLKPLEAMKKKIKDSAELKKQAKALSAKWRGPFTRDDKYRNSANELFADFFSAMLNNPDMVNTEFKLLHDAFEDLLQGKPEFREAYDELTNLISGKGIIDRIHSQFEEARTRSVSEIMDKRELKRPPIFESGVKAFVNEAYQARKIEKERAIGSAISEDFEYSRTWGYRETAVFENRWKRLLTPVMKRISDDWGVADVALTEYATAQRIIAERRAAGIWIEQNPEVMRNLLRAISTHLPSLNEFVADIDAAPSSAIYDLAAAVFAKIHSYGEKQVEFVADIIDQLELGPNGDALLAAFNVRGKLLNPSGMTPEDARDMITSLRKRFSPEQFSAIEEAADIIRDELFNYQTEAFKEGLISDQVYREIIYPNRSNFVPFVVLDHFNGRVGASVRQQHGTSKDIMSVMLAIPMKVASINQWRQTQRQAELLKQIHEKANLAYVINPNRLKTASDIHKIRVRNQDDTSRLLYYINGVPHVIEFPHDVGQSLQDFVEDDNFMKYATWLAQTGATVGTVAQAYTTFNMSFLLWNNPIRGLSTSAGRFGLTNTLRAQGRLVDAVKAAWSWTQAMYGGTMNSDAEKFVEAGLLLSPRVARTMYADADAARSLVDGGLIMSSQISNDMAHARSQWWRAGSFGRSAHQFFNSVMNTYEAFEKIMHYEAARKSGFDQTKAIALGRRGGIPNPGIGGKYSQAVEPFFLWTRVRLQGWRITQEIMRDPTMNKAYTRRFVMYELLPRLISWAIGVGLAAGWLDDDQEEKDGVWSEIYRRINPYKLALGRVIPIDLYDPRTGKHHSFSEFKKGSEIPDHYEVRSLRVPSSEEGRMFGALFYNLLVSIDGENGESMDFAGGNALKNFGSWVMAEVLPEPSPPIKMAGNVAMMSVMDINTTDTGRRTPNANKEMFEAGGWDKAQAVLGYVGRNLGGVGEVATSIAVNTGLMDPRAAEPLSGRVYTDKSPANELFPGGKAMWSHDNYARIRENVGKRQEDEQTRAKARLMIPDEARAAMQYYEKHKDNWRDLDPRSRVQYEAGKRLKETVWGDVTRRDAKTGQEIPLHADPNPAHFYAKAVHLLNYGGSEQAVETFKIDLAQACEPYVAVFENPDRVLKAHAKE